jgi:cytochrome c oxidase subunit 2
MRDRAAPVERGRASARGDFLNVLIIWAVVTAILALLTWLLPPRLYGLDPIAGDHANDYALTMSFFTYLADPVFAMVVVIALYAAFRFRSRGQPLTDGPRLVAGRGIQLVWVGVSVLLVIGLFSWGLIFLNQADAAPPASSNVLQVDVTGEQWNWNFTYPQYGNAQSDTLEVPVNRPILFKITSIDVTHSFSVPAWGIKMDANPGYFTYIRAVPNTMGTYAVRCYELCGMFHAYMQGQTKVVTPAAFATWVRQQPTGYPWGIGGAGLPHSSTEPTPLPLNPQPQTP